MQFAPSERSQIGDILTRAGETASSNIIKGGEALAKGISGAGKGVAKGVEGYIAHKEERANLTELGDYYITDPEEKKKFESSSTGGMRGMIGAKMAEMHQAEKQDQMDRLWYTAMQEHTPWSPSPADTAKGDEAGRVFLPSGSRGGGNWYAKQGAGGDGGESNVAENILDPDTHQPIAKSYHGKPLSGTAIKPLTPEQQVAAETTNTTANAARIKQLQGEIAKDPNLVNMPATYTGPQGQNLNADLPGESRQVALSRLLKEQSLAERVGRGEKRIAVENKGPAPASGISGQGSSRAEIQAAFKAGKITREEARKRLRDLGE